MTTTESVEDLLRDALDRLFRQEKRTEALEAILSGNVNKLLKNK